jgi:hypothetical protein
MRTWRLSFDLLSPGNVFPCCTSVLPIEYYLSPALKPGIAPFAAQ